MPFNNLTVGKVTQSAPEKGWLGSKPGSRGSWSHSIAYLILKRWREASREELPPLPVGHTKCFHYHSSPLCIIFIMQKSAKMAWLGQGGWSLLFSEGKGRAIVGCAMRQRLCLVPSREKVPRCRSTGASAEERAQPVRGLSAYRDLREADRSTERNCMKKQISNILSLYC